MGLKSLISSTTTLYNCPVLFLVTSIPTTISFFFFLNDPATTEFSTLPLHAPLPIPGHRFHFLGFHLPAQPRQEQERGEVYLVRSGRQQSRPETHGRYGAGLDAAPAHRHRDHRVEIGRAHV